jgi:hypothetical protein
MTTLKHAPIDLMAPSGPLAKYFIPPDEELAVVTEVVEFNGEPGGEVIKKPGVHDSSNLVDVLHFADWGGVERVFEVIGEVMEREPQTKAVLRLMQKSDGQVLAVVHLNALPFGSPVLDAVKALLHYSWKDIDYRYSGLTEEERSYVTPEQFELLTRWIGKSR